MKRTTPKAAFGDNRARLLQAENRRLRQLVAELTLDNYLLRTDVARSLLDKLRHQIEADAAFAGSSRKASFAVRSLLEP